MNINRIVYILDPATAQFRSTELPDLSPHAIKEALGYDAIDTTRFDRNHILYYNDNGLKQGISHYIKLAGHPDPFVGRVLLAPEVDGKLQVSAEEACARFSLHKPVMDPIVTSSRASNGDHTTFISSVEGFDTRIEQFDIEIVTVPVLNALALS